MVANAFDDYSWLLTEELPPDLKHKLEKAEALVLNASYLPVSYLPLSVLNWQDTIKNLYLGKAEVVEVYENIGIRSPSRTVMLPSVIVLQEYVKPKHRVSFTKNNVVLRDRNTCQYCGDKFSTVDLTYDHVIPSSQGGRTDWENIVSACNPCNLSKADKGFDRWVSPLGMRRPLNLPRIPDHRELEAVVRETHKKIPSKTWVPYLHWNGPLSYQDPLTKKITPITEGMSYREMTDAAAWHQDENEEDDET